MRPLPRQQHSLSAVGSVEQQTQTDVRGICPVPWQMAQEEFGKVFRYILGIGERGYYLEGSWGNYTKGP